jgi:hypothetical protein
VLSIIVISIIAHFWSSTVRKICDNTLILLIISNYAPSSVILRGSDAQAQTAAAHYFCGLIVGPHIAAPWAPAVLLGLHYKCSRFSRLRQTVRSASGISSSDPS